MNYEILKGISWSRGRFPRGKYVVTFECHVHKYGIVFPDEKTHIYKTDAPTGDQAMELARAYFPFAVSKCEEMHPDYPPLVRFLWGPPNTSDIYGTVLEIYASKSEKIHEGFYMKCLCKIRESEGNVKQAGEADECAKNWAQKVAYFDESPSMLMCRGLTWSIEFCISFLDCGTDDAHKPKYEVSAIGEVTTGQNNLLRDVEIEALSWIYKYVLVVAAEKHGHSDGVSEMLKLLSLLADHSWDRQPGAIERCVAFHYRNNYIYEVRYRAKVDRNRALIERFDRYKEEMQSRFEKAWRLY